MVSVVFLLVVLSGIVGVPSAGAWILLIDKTNAGNTGLCFYIIPFAFLFYFLTCTTPPLTARLPVRESGRKLTPDLIK